MTGGVVGSIKKQQPGAVLLGTRTNQNPQQVARGRRHRIRKFVGRPRLRRMARRCQRTQAGHVKRAAREETLRATKRTSVEARKAPPPKFTALAGRNSNAPRSTRTRRSAGGQQARQRRCCREELRQMGKMQWRVTTRQTAAGSAAKCRHAGNLNPGKPQAHNNVRRKHMVQQQYMKRRSSAPASNARCPEEKIKYTRREPATRAPPRVARHAITSNGGNKPCAVSTPCRAFSRRPKYDTLNVVHNEPKSQTFKPTSTAIKSTTTNTNNNNKRHVR